MINLVQKTIYETLIIFIAEPQISFQCNDVPHRIAHSSFANAYRAQADQINIQSEASHSSRFRTHQGSQVYCWLDKSLVMNVAHSRYENDFKAKLFQKSGNALLTSIPNSRRLTRCGANYIHLWIIFNPNYLIPHLSIGPLLRKVPPYRYRQCSYARLIEPVSFLNTFCMKVKP